MNKKVIIIYCGNNKVGRFHIFYGTRLCVVEGCFEKAGIVSGYCKEHYYRNILGIKPRFYGTHLCYVENCTLKVYAKNLCHNHYELKRRTGEIEYRKRIKILQCQVEGCFNKGPYSLGYCYHHYSRFKNGLSLIATRKELFSGKNNPRWAGGTSEYPNHSLMKKVRLEVLKKANYICHFCGGLADRIHHLDKSKDNHSKENLVPSCPKCNAKLAKPHTSKYKRLHGHTHKELTAMGFFKIKSKYKRLYGYTFEELRKSGFFRKNKNSFHEYYNNWVNNVSERLKIGL